jgi:hypothetical protein
VFLKSYYPNFWWKLALSFSSDSTKEISTIFSSIRAQTKWYLISICFILGPKTALFAKYKAPTLSTLTIMDKLKNWFQDIPKPAWGNQLSTNFWECNIFFFTWWQSYRHWFPNLPADKATLTVDYIIWNTLLSISISCIVTTTISNHLLFSCQTLTWDSWLVSSFQCPEHTW